MKTSETEPNPVMPVSLDRTARKALIDAVQASAAPHRADGPDAAHSQDFLHGEDGLPA